jgi:hypothetical protein
MAQFQNWVGQLCEASAQHLFSSGLFQERLAVVEQDILSEGHTLNSHFLNSWSSHALLSLLFSLQSLKFNGHQIAQYCLACGSQTHLEDLLKYSCWAPHAVFLIISLG